MRWNHRVIKSGDEFVIREVYYKNDGTVEAWTAGPAIPSAETVGACGGLWNAILKRWTSL